MPLNPRQLRFVEHYMAGSPASAAYRRAGDRCRIARAAESKASQLLKHPGVVAAACRPAGGGGDRRGERRAGGAGLLAAAEDRGDGSSHAARVAAWTTLARHLGMLRDRQEVSGPAGGPVPVQAYIPANGRDPAAPTREDAA